MIIKNYFSTADGSVLIACDKIRKSTSFTHFSDAHLVEWDERDPGAKKWVDLWSGGTDTRGRIDALKKAHLERIDRDTDFVIHTGDMLSPCTLKGIETLKAMNSSLKVPVYGCSGNHDYDYQFKGDYHNYLHMKSAYTDFGGCFSIEFNDVGFLFFDNSNYHFDEVHLDLLERFEEGEKPYLTFFHIPLYQKYLQFQCRSLWKGALMMVGEKNNPNGDINTPEDLEFCATIKESKLNIGVFSGHVHLSHFELLNHQSCQFVTESVLQRGYARKVRVSPLESADQFKTLGFNKISAEQFKQVKKNDGANCRERKKNKRFAQIQNDL